MNWAYLGPLIGLAVALLLGGIALVLIRRPPVNLYSGPEPPKPHTGARVVVIGGGFTRHSALHRQFAAPDPARSADALHS